MLAEASTQCGTIIKTRDRPTPALKKDASYTICTIDVAHQLMHAGMQVQTHTHTHIQRIPRQAFRRTYELSHANTHTHKEEHTCLFGGTRRPPTKVLYAVSECLKRPVSTCRHRPTDVRCRQWHCSRDRGGCAARETRGFGNDTAAHSKEVCAKWTRSWSKQGTLKGSFGSPELSCSNDSSATRREASKRFVCVTVSEVPKADHAQGNLPVIAILAAAPCCHRPVGADWVPRGS